MSDTHEPVLRIHLIGAGADDAREHSVAELGFKAFNLARLARLGMPVPAAFVLGTDWCRAVAANGGELPAGARDSLLAALRSIEAATGLGFGSGRRPLLVSVRSGAPVSMPGMLETVLDVGLCDATVPGLLRLTGNPRLVWDSYRRFIESYAETVAGLPPALFSAAQQDALERTGAATLAGLDFRALRALARQQLETYQQVAGEPFPQSPIEQLERSICAVFRSWDADKARYYRAAHGIDATLGTAATVQRMVFGNAGGTSGAGVGFTRDPATGEGRLYLDYVANAQGEDVVSGRATLATGTAADCLSAPVLEELGEIATLLEQEFRDVQDFEFTVENGELYILQTRDAKRTPLATLRTAVELAESGLISAEEARRRAAALRPEQLEQVELAGADGTDRAAPLAKGIAASVGVASGVAVLDLGRAIERARGGEAVILVREDVSTADIAGVEAAAGLLAARGARTSHAAVVARQLGKACVVGCTGLSIDAQRHEFALGDVRFAEGEWLTLDATTGAVYRGALAVVRRRPQELLGRLDRLR